MLICFIPMVAILFTLILTTDYSRLPIEIKRADVTGRQGMLILPRPLTEYIECLAEHLGNCPTQHKTAVLGAKSRWTQYISSCALTLPFQEEDSREDTLAEQIQRGSDEVRSNLNGVISLSQPNLNRFLMAPENAVIEKMADVAGNIVENVKENVDEVLDNSLGGPEGMDDVVENVRDIIVSKINSAQPILQQFADKLETKRDDVNTDSNTEDVDEVQSEETDDTQRIGDDRQSTEVDTIPTLDSVSVEVLDDIVDFLNDHLSADDGNIDTELDAGDSGDSQENDDSKHITDDSNENIDDSKDDDVESNEDNETDDSKETVEDDNSENTDLDDSQESNSQEDIVDTDNSDENDNNDESNENDSDEFDDDSHDKTDDHSQNDSDENDSHDDKIDIDDSDENSGYRHGEADDSQEDDQSENSDENDNVSSDENDDNHDHADSHDNLEELSDLTLLSDPSTGTANTGGNARLRPGMGVGGVHQYSSMGDGNSGALITPWTTLLVLCVALVISTL